MSNTKDASPDAPLTRDQMRAHLLGSKKLADSRIITLFGMEVELRQPTFGSIMDAREEESQRKRAADMIIKFSYVPGTDEQIFEDGDVEGIMTWPFGPDLLKLQETITELTGVDVEIAEEELGTDPLPVQS